MRRRPASGSSKRCRAVRWRAGRGGAGRRSERASERALARLAAIPWRSTGPGQMEREARCGKGQVIRAGSGHLDPGGRVQEARGRVSAGAAGRLGSLQATAGGGSEEALVFRVEAVQESEALAWQQEAVLVVEDSLQVVREEIVVSQEAVEDELGAGPAERSGVVAAGRNEAQAAGRSEVQAAASEEQREAGKPEEKAVEPELAQPGRSGPRFGSPLEALEAVQLELRAQTARDGRAYCRLRRTIRQRRQPHVEHRRNIIQCIPGFWAKAVSFGVRLLGLAAEWDDREGSRSEARATTPPGKG